MSFFLLIILILCSFFVNGQKKGDNTIIVKGVSFREVVVALLDKGFHIEKIDSSFFTIRTEPTRITTKNAVLISMDIRVKDSSAIIKAGAGLKESDFKNKRFNIFTEDYYSEVFYNNESSLKEKDPFAAMNKFALSFGKPVGYQNNRAKGE